jgi:hypothetical protein
MSASNRPEDLDEPSRYAPKWVREGQQKPFTSRLRHMPAAPQIVSPDPRDALEPVDPAGQFDPPEPAEVREPPSVAPGRRASTFEGDAAIRRMRMQRSLEPERVAEPQWEERRSPFGMIARTALALGIATVGALIYVGVLPLPFGQTLSVSAVPETTGIDQRAPDQREPRRPAKVAERVGELRIPPEAREQPAPPAPQTVARLEDPAASPPSPAPVRSWPQGVAPSWPQSGPAAASPAPVAPAAVLTPPAPAVQPPPPAAATQAPPPVASARQLAPDEIETLIKRGEAYVNQGDISAGRLMLKRAADAGSPRAALILGGTYDPEVLRKLGVLGFQADSAQARTWYEKAATLGSTEATRRLAGLGR